MKIFNIVRLPKVFLLSLACLGFAMFSMNSRANEYPSKPITVIVPYAAGGSSDVVARLIAERMGAYLKQALIVDNKAGAGATIGTAFAAKQGQEGYTLLLADNAQSVATATYKKLPYDAVGDFSMVGFVGYSPVMIFASQASGIRSLKGLQEESLRKKGEITVGTGYGSPSHLMTELFQIRSGIKLQTVPYKGASAALADLLGGHIDLVLSNPASGASYIATGKVSVLAQTGVARDSRFSNVPTFRESGVSDFDVTYWFALLAPGDTPAPALQKLRSALVDTLSDKQILKKLEDLGITPAKENPQAGMEKIREEAQLWQHVVTSSGIKKN